jgi:hypothetical protein
MVRTARNSPGGPRRRISLRHPVEKRRKQLRRESSGYRSTQIANRRYCVVNHGVTLDDYARRSCSMGLHIHLSKAEADELLSFGAIEHLCEPDDTRRGYIFRFKRTFAVRGLSARFGEEIAHMMARDMDRNFAQFLLSEIRHRGGRTERLPYLDEYDRRDVAAD